MSYIQHNFGLSPDQLSKLSKGQAVRLTVDKLDGSVPVFLTKTQLNRVQKMKGEGKGMDLQLSAAQLRYNRKQQGSGFKEDMLKLLKGTAGNLANLGIDEGAKFIKGKITDMTGRGRGGKAIRDGINRGMAQQDAFGVQDGRAVQGAGWGDWDDVGNFFGDTARGARDVGLAALYKRLGGGAMKGKKKGKGASGGSMLLPGYQGKGGIRLGPFGFGW